MRSEELECAAPFEGAGSRGDAELAVDGPDVGMNCVVRYIQFMADVALGQLAGE